MCYREKLLFNHLWGLESVGKCCLKKKVLSALCSFAVIIVSSGSLAIIGP